MSKAKVRPVPEDFHTITPQIVVKDAAKAIEWYSRALGAHELLRHHTPDGKRLMHSELLLGDSRFFVHDEFPDWGVRGPDWGDSAPVRMHLYVEDVDVWFNRAVKAGAKVLMPVQDQFWGDRYCMIADPFGHHWSIASRIEDLSPQQMGKRAEQWNKANPDISNKSNREV